VREFRLIGVFEADGELDGLVYDLLSPQEARRDDEEEGTYVLPGGFSTGLPAAYTLKGWNE
jgi:hypothetical protein